MWGFPFIVWLSVLSFIITIYTKKQDKKLYRRKSYNSKNLNPGLALTSFRTILLCFQQVNLTWAGVPIEKAALGQRSTKKKHVTSISCRLEPVKWSRVTGQQIPCFDRCQLIITWMSNIKEVLCKPRLHISVNLLHVVGGWLPSCATPPLLSPSSSCIHAHEQYR